MRNTGSSGRSKSTKDKSSKVSSHNNTSNTGKSEGPPLKSIQATAEQVALNNLIQGKDTDDEEQKRQILQIVELTGCSQGKAEIALYDSKNDMNKAVEQILEGKADESEWRESGKKKKKQKAEVAPVASNDNNYESKPDKRDNNDRNERDTRDRNDRDNRDRNKDENDRMFRESSDNYRKPRRNDNRPPRLSRGRGRPDRGDREDDMERDDVNKERSFERGRGRGRGGFGARRGRGGGGGGGGAAPFRPVRSAGFEKTSQFDNGPQIDTWTNETAVIGEKEPKISNWSDSKEDWSEDIDSWSGSLAETKVFTASGNTATESNNATVPIDTNSLSNTFDYGVLNFKHSQNDIGGDASYINTFNQQATESIKNTIGIGSGTSSSLQSSMTSQTASNVSALVSLTQNALQDTLVTDLTGSPLTGNSLVGTSLGNSGLSSSLPVNNLAGLSGELSGTSLSAGSNGSTVVTGSLSYTSQSTTSLVPGSTTAPSITTTAAMLQQRAKPQRSKLPPPSKIPASAVEMPGHMMASLDVQFGSLEFSFGGNESASSAFTAAAGGADTTTSTSMDHVTGQVGQSSLSSTNDNRMSAAGLEQSSPRNSNMYQQSPYTTPTKHQPTQDSNNKMSVGPDPLTANSTDLKSSPLLQQTTAVSLPSSTKVDVTRGSYSSSSSYPSSSYQGQKSSSSYQGSNKQSSYPGSTYQQSNNSSSSNQYSSQYRPAPNQSNQFSNTNQFQSGNQYQSPPSGYQSSPTGYSSQSSFGGNQSQYQSGQSQYGNFQSGSTFPSQTGYSSNTTGQNSLYPTPSTGSYSNPSQQSSLYSQNNRQSSYSNQSYMNHDHGASSATSFQVSVTRSSSPFKDTQTGANSYRDNVSSTSGKSRDPQSDNSSSSYTRDTNSASSFSDSQSLAFNRDSQSVGSSYSRDPSSGYKRDSKSASATYPRDTSDSGTYNRDSQSASASFTGRDNSVSSTGYRDSQSGAASYGNQTGSYPRDTTSNTQQPQGFNPKPFRNVVTEVSTTLPTSLSSSKLVDTFSKMGVNDGSLGSSPANNSQFDVTSSKLTTSSSSLSSSTTPSSSSSSTTTTVTNITTTKISTLPTTSTSPSSSTSSTSGSKAPPNLPPGVPLMAQQYIMGQAGGLPIYGMPGIAQQPMYANLEDFQYLQQRLPPNLASNMFDSSIMAAAAGLQLPPTTLATNTSQQPTLPTVPYSGSNDSVGKLNRVEAQSPTATIPTSTPSATGQTQHQQPYIHLNYSYYYPSIIPGTGFQYPMIPMPQVTNATHTATPPNTQYQQKTQYGAHVQYATNKGAYDDLPAVHSAGDYLKSPYGTTQTQAKANVNSTMNAATGNSDIQLSANYGKTHAQQAFDKQGFHAGTPPPFNMPLAAGQLATGSQAGPMGTPTGPYGAPYVPLMTHQPHSQMIHHPLQDTGSSNRASQQSSMNPSKSSSKSYSGTNWGNY